jgi:hypothetical protein
MFLSPQALRGAVSRLASPPSRLEMLDARLAGRATGTHIFQGFEPLQVLKITGRGSRKSKLWSKGYLATEEKGSEIAFPRISGLRFFYFARRLRPLDSHTAHVAVTASAFVSAADSVFTQSSSGLQARRGCRSASAPAQKYRPCSRSCVFGGRVPWGRVPSPTVCAALAL